MKARGTFRFLNEERALGWPMDWHSQDGSLLWRYNLHYFDDLNAADAEQRSQAHLDLIASWIDCNPPGSQPGWDSYPLSLRIVNWIKWSFDGGQLSSAALASLAQQVRWLAARLEWHLLGNHLFANAKALVFAGCYFRGPEARKWRERGSRVVAKQLEQQVLPDGGNFELSPMYHAIFLADVLDLINVSRHFPGVISRPLEADLVRRAASMLRWLEVMVHPDRQISLFNDSALGIAPELDELHAYAKRLGIASSRNGLSYEPGEPSATLLSKSGYARLECADVVVICDVAEIGPDYLPGHAHADTLSFEMSIDGRRFFVNGGTSRYGADEARVRERGTPAHNTVTINGCNSSEVWSGFRVARRARPFDVTVERSTDRVRLAGSHDGYARLHRAIVHRRNWVLSRQSLLIEDDVGGPIHRGAATYLLHHDVSASPIAANAWMLRHRKSARAVRCTVLKGNGRIVPATHSLEFGRIHHTMALIVELDGGASRVEIAW